MSEQDNNLSGVLFKNNRRREGGRDPEYQGNCEIDGKQFWISAWVNTSKKDGSKFFGLKFKPKEEPKSSPKAAEQPPDEGDKVPF